MKKHLILCFAATSLLLSACKNDAPTQEEEGTTTSALEAATTPNETPSGEALSSLSGTEVMALSPSIAESAIEWTAGKATGSSHTGSIRLLNGTFNIIRGNLKRGTFDIDMNSITVNGMEADKKADLENHLKSPDFFDVAKHPVGNFEITGAIIPESGAMGATHVIKGNLTLKGITKEITFAANVSVQDKNVVINSTPSFGINRTDWDIKYKSGMLGTVKDEIINDEIIIKLHVVAPLTGAQ
ncbi:MAG: YceI family protein [Saprospiraceae bacterium]|nr:YceI family protein [Saprospiraceae bacterium]